MKTRINAYVIGVGGVGSWLAPALCKLYQPEGVVLIDGDQLELKNLDRQLFTLNELGRHKASCLAQRLNCAAVCDWFALGKQQFTDNDWLLCCADNHPARRATLETCDTDGCQAIIGANETTSSEAYYYRRDWRGGPLDPRVYYPEILTNRDGDPRAAAIGCTGQAQEETPQLVSANLSAAALMLQLLVAWEMHAPKLSESAQSSLPYRLNSNLSRLEFRRIKDNITQ